MSAIADNLPIEDVHPQESAPQAEPESVTPPVESTPEPVAAPQDKAPQPIPNETVPRWRLNEVLEQNRALKAQMQQSAPQPQQPQAPKPPNADDFAAQGKTFEEFQDAKAAFIAEQAAENKWNALQQQSAQQTQSRQFQERVDTAENTFAQKLHEAAATDPNLIQKLVNAPTLRPDLHLFMKESDAPIEIVKHLAENPALIFQLNQMGQDKAFRELTRLESKLTTVSGGPSRMPSAKAPNLDPVGGGNTPAPKNPYSLQTSEVDYVAATRRLPRK